MDVDSRTEFDGNPFEFTSVVYFIKNFFTYLTTPTKITKVNSRSSSSRDVRLPLPSVNRGRDPYVLVY